MKRVSHTPPLLHPQFWMFLASLAQVWQEDIYPVMPGKGEEILIYGRFANLGARASEKVPHPHPHPSPC